MTPTPHIGAQKDQVAKKVLMAGDPLRAKFVAENWLKNPVLYNEVRGMLGYTGKYNGQMVSVQGHGMGIPSIGIYSYELFTFYDVDVIIRFGTCGAMDPNIKVGTIIIADSATTDSNYGYQFNLPEGYKATASPELVEKAEQVAKELGYDYIKGCVFSSDVFYDESGKQKAMWVNDGVLAVEMEAHALYTNAFAKGKKALTILTVSDNLTTGEEMPSEQRQLGLKRMIDVALGI